MNSELHDQMLKAMQDRDPKARLAALQCEMATPVSTILGVEKLLRRMDPDTITNSPEEYRFLLDQLARSAHWLQCILDALRETNRS
jgi:hypothetical protein